MRVAVVGASGNVGTGVLRALAADRAIDSVVAIARRVPDTTQAPYGSAQWVALDLADADRAAVRDELRRAFAGVDAVIHLAWAIQPNTQRAYLRRVNVDGTRIVAETAAAAGVGHLVVASSVGVYSPVDDQAPRDEDAPREGIPSSHYSVDKAAQEQVLDEVESAHPQLLLSRMRMALVFQGDAGAEIVRYFLGPLVPTRLLRTGVLPVLPLPSGVHLQAVHADDAGRAYVAVVTQRAGGAFNVAASDTLGPADLGRILGRGPVVELPPQALRPLLAGAWRTRLVPTDAGWLDMALGAPVMDTGRIRALGWTERHTAEDALLELLAGARRRRGTASPVLRGGDTTLSGLESASGGHGAGSDGYSRRQLPTEALSARVPAQLEAPLLGLYLSDHLTGATAGVNRIQRMAHAYAGTDLGPDLERICAEIGDEVDLLREIIDVLGLRQRPHRQAAAWLAERAGRLKANQRLVDPSPMTPLLELELMRSAVNGKAGLWETLAALAADLSLPDDLFPPLADRAKDQAEVLARLHQRVRRDAFLRETRP